MVLPQREVAACPCLSAPASVLSTLLSLHCQLPVRLRWDLGMEQPSSRGNTSFDSFPKYGHIILI